MNLPEASILNSTAIHTFVVCPYCHRTHKHGKINRPECRMSECMRGEYLIKPKSSLEIR